MARAVAAMANDEAAIWFPLLQRLLEQQYCLAEEPLMETSPSLQLVAQDFAVASWPPALVTDFYKINSKMQLGSGEMIKSQLTTQ